MVRIPDHAQKWPVLTGRKTEIKPKPKVFTNVPKYTYMSCMCSWVNPCINSAIYSSIHPSIRPYIYPSDLAIINPSSHTGSHVHWLGCTHVHACTLVHAHTCNMHTFKFTHPLSIGPSIACIHTHTLEHAHTYTCMHICRDRWRSWQRGRFEWSVFSPGVPILNPNIQPNNFHGDWWGYSFYSHSLVYRWIK